MNSGLRVSGLAVALPGLIVASSATSLDVKETVAIPFTTVAVTDP